MHLHVLSADMCSSGVTGGTICPLESGSSYATCPQLAANLACTATGELTTPSGYSAVSAGHAIACDAMSGGQGSEGFQTALTVSGTASMRSASR